jgi:tRNA-dihydrouridine synthase B
MLAHLEELYRFYGKQIGVRVARKHLLWYCRNRSDAENYRTSVIRVETAEQQMLLTRHYFEAAGERVPAA